jgi:hypothetical protein
MLAVLALATTMSAATHAAGVRNDLDESIPSEEWTPPDRTVLKDAHGPKIHLDVKGRISRIESNGKYADFAYDPQERLHSIVSSRGRLYELLYSDVTAQKPYAVVIDGHQETLPLKAPPHPKSTEKQFEDPYYYDWWDVFGYEQTLMDQAVHCFACISSGGTGNLTDAISNLANWLQVGGALGSVIGASIAIYLGGDANAILIGAGLGALPFMAIAIGWAGGWQIGTVVYDSNADAIAGWVGP